jgi:hypothetical protein
MPHLAEPKGTPSLIRLSHSTPFGFDQGQPNYREGLPCTVPKETVTEPEFTVAKRFITDNVYLPAALAVTLGTTRLTELELATCQRPFCPSLVH